jgi:hypothetical protein
VSRIAIRDMARQIALAEVGVREVGGLNRGPQVELYLAAVGRPAGDPWCCAFVVWCYREATLRASTLTLPLHRTGKCARLWARADVLWRSDQPSVGAVYIHLVDPGDPESAGHCGIVTGFTDRTVMAVEGNTNASGSRLGDRVRINTRRRDYVNAGYIDVGREGPVDSPDVA